VLAWRRRVGIPRRAQPSLANLATANGPDQANTGRIFKVMRRLLFQTWPSVSPINGCGKKQQPIICIDGQIAVHNHARPLKVVLDPLGHLGDEVSQWELEQSRVLGLQIRNTRTVSCESFQSATGIPAARSQTAAHIALRHTP
jgi:hypothetical protein